MKQVQYTFEVPDFCPEKCAAFNPAHFLRSDTFGCLHQDQCAELHRNLALIAQADRELDAIMERAGQAAAPTTEMEAEADGED